MNTEPTGRKWRLIYAPPDADSRVIKVVVWVEARTLQEAMEIAYQTFELKEWEIENAEKREYA